MRNNKFIIGVILGVGLIVAGGRVEAKDKSFHATFSGTLTNKDDLSFTGASGSSGTYATVAGKSPLGPYAAQLVVEAQLDGNTCPLPNDSSGVEFVFVGEVVVLSFAATGACITSTMRPTNTSSMMARGISPLAPCRARAGIRFRCSRFRRPTGSPAGALARW